MAKVFDLNGNVTGQIELPAVFKTPLRPDVIQRAVLALQSQRRQPYGLDKLAGRRSSAHYHGMRHYRFTMMNRETARMPRIHGKSAGYMAMRARNVPQAVKGRRAHGPKAEKIWRQELNKKEHLLAIASALAAAANVELVKAKGHIVDAIDLPIVVTDEFEKISKAKQARDVLAKIKLDKELQRCGKRKVRAGRGKMRGRRYQEKRGPLVITSKNCQAIKACRNIPGVDVSSIEDINAELLAPGAHAGRLTVLTQSAVKALDNLEACVSFVKRKK